MATGIISDFNSDLFSRLLQNKLTPEQSVITFPYGQVIQGLVNISKGIIPSNCYMGGTDANIINISDKERLDNLIIWTRPENVLGSFKKALDYEKVDQDILLSEVETFAHMILNCADTVSSLFVMSWEIPIHHKGYGMSDYRPQQGLQYLLNLINNKLADILSTSSNIYLLNTANYFDDKDDHLSNPKLWFSAKIPYNMNVFTKAAEDFITCLSGIKGKSRRLVVVDLDNTLWGGILGDLGWENLKLGGHDIIGEAYVDFQKKLKALTNRGIILAISSKNYEKKALEAIENHPEMVLKRDDFASWQINWNDKAQNIVEIANDVNLGLESIVFIDDNPAERGRVSEALPEVYVPEWPADPTSYSDALLKLTCFNMPITSIEDRNRSKMFVEERKRNALKSSLTQEDWLNSIGLTVEIEPLNDINKTRTAQLLSKSNQFNLSTRRLSEKEFSSWATEKDKFMWTFTVSDKFGQTGLTGVISLEKNESIFEITDFVLSCRVMGRQIEDLMIGYAINYAKLLGCKKISVKYIETKKNQPILDFLNNSDLTNEENLYTWDCQKSYPIPSFINVID